METMKLQQAMYIRQLGELSRAALPEAGGKGANLGELINAGLPVPPGFVVAASAYRALLAANGLTERIAGRLQAMAAQAPEDVAAASRDIGGWIAAADVPAAIRAEVVGAYADLSEQMAPGGAGLAVAVRSSATAEDLPSASFAGQQETFLHISGAEQVMRHVQQCWASLWTPQAISYRASMGFEHMGVALAVVVQAMVDAEVAGVMFTANPVSGARDEILISASYGLGEAVVSGMVTPDTFLLSTDGALRSRTLGAKESRIVPDGSGTRSEPVPPAEQARFCLGDQDLAGLAGLARRVQVHYGAPQDTEWALCGGQLYLLQARPITTLAKAPNDRRAGRGADQPQAVWRQAAGRVLARAADAAGCVVLPRVQRRWQRALSHVRHAAPSDLPDPVERDDGRMAVRVSSPGSRRRSSGSCRGGCCSLAGTRSTAGGLWQRRWRRPRRAGRPPRRPTRMRRRWRGWWARRCATLGGCSAGASGRCSSLASSTFCW